MTQCVELMGDELLCINYCETKTDAAEVRDRENRRNNIVIYRLKESSAQSAEDRKKQDIETCLDLIHNTLEVDCRVEDLK